MHGSRTIPRLHLLWSNRDFTTMAVPPDLTYRIRRYRKSTLGGPLYAHVQAAGEEAEIWRLLSMLRSPIEIYDDVGRVVWWGMLDTVEVTGEGYSIKLSLEKLANRIAVAYSATVAGVNLRGTTDWAEHAESVAAYGEKEFLFSLPDHLPNAAQQARDNKLAETYKPDPILGTGGGEQLNAELSFSGWYSTLAWKYYEQSDLAEGYLVDPDAEQEFGDASTEMVEQEYIATGADDWLIPRISVTLAKVGFPTDNVVLGIYTDSGGDPDTLLGSASIAGGNIEQGTPTFLTQDVTGSSISQVAGTTYHLRVSRSGAQDAANYYLVGVNESLGYLSGDFQIYTGAAWGARPTDADMPFYLSAAWESSTQIRDILDDVGQFLVDYSVVDTGLEVAPYVAGDKRATAILEKRLEAGTDGGQRLMATVGSDRRITVEEEPDTSEAAYTLRADGSIVDGAGIHVPLHTCPVGIHLQLGRATQLPLGTFELIGLEQMFVVASEYTPSTGELTIQTRGAPDPWKITEVAD